MRLNKIFITGATGFLGIHVLKQLIEDTDSIVYCLVRADNDELAQRRLQESLIFYFGNLLDDELGKRIIAIKGDFTQDKLGINREHWKMMCEQIDVVIHMGAIVKHSGYKDEFNRVNTLGTYNIIEYAKANNIYLIYISSMAIAGKYSKYERNKMFTEKDTYIGQNSVRNLYTKSKLLCEEKLLQAKKDNLKGVIVRLGALTGRYSDGMFQRNEQENAQYSRIRFIEKSGVVPEMLMDLKIEFSPIDYCSKAIVMILRNVREDQDILHVYNHKVITYSDLVNYMHQLGLKVDVLEKEAFDIFTRKIEDPVLRREFITGFCLFMRRKDDEIYRFPITISNEATTKWLKSLGFEWPAIDCDYLKKILFTNV